MSSKIRSLLSAIALLAIGAAVGWVAKDRPSDSYRAKHSSCLIEDLHGSSGSGAISPRYRPHPLILQVGDERRRLNPPTCDEPNNIVVHMTVNGEKVSLVLELKQIE